MYIAARLWDVDTKGTPADDDDTQTLVTRGVYRLGGVGSNPASFKLFGNAWQFDEGHLIKVELTADDSPSFQVWNDGQPGTIDVSNVSLTVPLAHCARHVSDPCPP